MGGRQGGVRGLNSRWKEGEEVDRAKYVMTHAAGIKCKWQSVSIEYSLDRDEYCIHCGACHKKMKHDVEVRIVKMFEICAVRSKSIYRYSSTGDRPEGL